MRKTVPVSNKHSTNKLNNNVSDSTVSNRRVSDDGNNPYHDVGAQSAAANKNNSHHERDCVRSNSGLVVDKLSTTGDRLSTTGDRPIDKHLHNNLSPDLSTALRPGGFTGSLVNREKQSMRELGNPNGNTALQQCVVEELEKYFAMLEGHPPNDLYKLVITQVETALFGYVLEACGNNQSRAAEYLGVSRGTLRNRIVDLSLD